MQDAIRYHERTEVVQRIAMRIPIVALALLLALPAAAQAAEATTLAPANGVKVKADRPISYVVQLPDGFTPDIDSTVFAQQGETETFATDLVETSIADQYRATITFPTIGKWTLSGAITCSPDDPACVDNYPDLFIKVSTITVNVVAPIKAPRLKSANFGFNPTGCEYGCEKITVNVCAPRGRMWFVNIMRYTLADVVNERAEIRKSYLHPGGCKLKTVQYARPDNMYGIGYHRDNVHMEDRFGQRSNVKTHSSFTVD